MFNGDNFELVWFIVGMVLMLAELAMPGFVVFFFGVGAWITALGVWIGVLESFNSQLVVFLAASILSLVILRRKWQSYLKGRVAANPAEAGVVDDVRGQKARAITDIEPRQLGGKVEFNGTLWEAESDSAIQKGAVVEIVERANLVLKVKPY